MNLNFLQKLKKAVFPEDVTCDICGAELVAETRYRLCAGCMCAMPFVAGDVCKICGVPMANEAEYCLRCQRSESVFLLNRSPLVYEGDALRLIHALKFGRKRYAAKTLAAMMADTYLKEGMQADALVPVPMTSAEVKARGFNQAELLAKELSSRLLLPLLPALVKVRETGQQKKLTAAERAKNLEGAFSVQYKQVHGLRVLLVDDIFTTGATANECARTLLHAKAKQVSVLTAAVTKQKLQFEQNAD